jgi:hypothetical protein
MVGKPVYKHWKVIHLYPGKREPTSVLHSSWQKNTQYSFIKLLHDIWLLIFFKWKKLPPVVNFWINEHTIAQASHLNKEENAHLHAHVALSAKSQNW